MGQVWPHAFVEEHNLTVHVSKLRKALGCEHCYVETVARHGYRFVAAVTRIAEQEDVGRASEAGTAPAGKASRLQSPSSPSSSSPAMSR